MATVTQEETQTSFILESDVLPVTIPLTNSPESFFRIELNGKQLDFRTLYNSRDGVWSFDVSENGSPLKNGISLVLGTDLLKAYNTGIGSFVMVDTENNGVDADADSIGTRQILLYYTPEEVEEISNG